MKKPDRPLHALNFFDRPVSAIPSQTLSKTEYDALFPDGRTPSDMAGGTALSKSVILESEPPTGPDLEEAISRDMAGPVQVHPDIFDDQS